MKTNSSTSKFTLIVGALTFALGLMAGIAVDRCLEAPPAPVPDSPAKTDKQAESKRPAVVEPTADDEEEAPEPRRRFRHRQRMERAEAEPEAAPAEAVAEATPPEREHRGPGRGFDPAMARQHFAMRQQEACAQAVESLGLDETGSANFHAVVDDMNAKLMASMETLESLAQGQPEGAGPFATPELRVRAMAECALIMTEAYESLGSVVPEDRRGDVQQVDMMRMISPEVFMPVMRMMNMRGGFGRRGGAQR